MKFLLPQGIGDAVWALHKIKSVAKGMGADKIEVYLNYAAPWNEIQSRAKEFISRFSFIYSCEMLNIMIHDYGCSVDKEGHYIYIPDGWISPYWDLENKYYALMPNAPLERGIRLENWLPEFEIDWNISSEFKFYPHEIEYAHNLKKRIGEYCVFYLGPYRGNMYEGHNRNCIWTPRDWISLSHRIYENLGLKIVVLGAYYDMEYWTTLMEPALATDNKGWPEWRNLIGELTIGKSFAVAKNARFVVSYQSGIGIFSSYMRVPTAIFWRAKGDTISPDSYLSFEEEMASAWVRPDMLAERKHLPLIYGRHTPEYIMNEIVQRGW